MGGWIQNKPLQGTPLISGHPHIPKGGWWLFQEGMGDRIGDLSGNGNVGIATGMSFPSTVASSWNPGLFGSAPIYDGTDDEIIVPDAPRLSSLDQSIMFWMRAIVPVAEAKVLIGKTAEEIDPGLISGWNIAIDADHLLKWWITGTIPVAGTTVVDGGEWVHIGCSRQGIDETEATYRIYINGVLEAEADHDDALDRTYNSTHDLTFASGFFNIPVRYGNFQMDDIRIFRRVVLGSEVQDIKSDPFAAFTTGIDVALLAQLANLMAMERSISRRVHGRVFGRVN